MLVKIRDPGGHRARWQLAAGGGQVHFAKRPSCWFHAPSLRKSLDTFASSATSASALKKTRKTVRGRWKAGGTERDKDRRGDNKMCTKPSAMHTRTASVAARGAALRQRLITGNSALDRHCNCSADRLFAPHILLRTPYPQRCPQV
eukprot:516798-Rhodomonas_salina.1